MGRWFSLSVCTCYMWFGLELQKVLLSKEKVEGKKSQF